MSLPLFREVLVAGAHALAEARESGLDDENTAVHVYMAMDAVLEIAKLHLETVH